MGNIIKTNGGRRPPVSDYDRDRAPVFDDMVDDLDLDPRSILAEARIEAEQKVREAYEEGLRRGHAAGQQQFDEGVGQAVDTLHGVCEQMMQARTEFLDSLQPQLVRLAVLLAERILEREVQLDQSVIATTARAALEHVLDAERVVLRVNPRDIEVLRERKADYLAEFEQIETIDLSPDTAIASGGCIAATDQLEIDARLSEQLATMMGDMLARSNGAVHKSI